MFKNTNSRRQTLKMLAATATLGSTFGASSVSAQSASKGVRLAHLVAESEPTHAAAVQWAEAIKARTKGGFDAQLFPNSQLGSEREVIEQARLGSNVIEWSSPAFVGEFVPDFEVMWSPFLFKNAAEVQKVADSDLSKQWQQKLIETRGVRILAFNWYFGARHVMTTNRAIRNPEDLRGLKLRSVPVPATISMMKQMGASPTPLAFAEVYPAMAQGVINGCEVPLSTMFGSKLYEVGKHVSLTGHVIQTQIWVVGERFYQSLPADVRSILSEEAIKAGQNCSQMAQSMESEFRKKLEAAGVTFTEPNRQAFEDLGAVVQRELSPRWSSGLLEKVRAIKAT